MDPRHQFDFQTDLPVFVRSTPAGMDYIKMSGRKYHVGDHIPWQELGFEYEIIKRFFDLKLFHHNTEKTVESRVGDGLDMMTYEELESLVDSINAKVKKHTRTEADFNKYKVKKSKIRDKQMGLLRSWRRFYGRFESM